MKYTQSTKQAHTLACSIEYTHEGSDKRRFQNRKYMKVITEVYNVFSFDELSKESQAKAIENLRDINVEDDWHDPDIDDMQSELEALGYNGAKIGYEGFWSQGDGAHFTATVDIAKFLKTHKLISKFRKVYKESENCTITIKHNGRYEHEMCMYTDSEAYGMSEAVQDELVKLEEYILNEARDEARKIYKRLEKQYYALTSDEEVIETIKCNEYTFLENGTMKNA